MKTQNAFSRFFFVLTLFAFSFTFNACSDDDDEPENNTNQTCTSLLECQANTVWENNLAAGYYMVLNNNTSNPFTLYFENDGCYLKMDANEIGNVSMTEHTVTKFVFKDQGADWEDVYTITYANNQITLKIEYYENNVLDETETVTYQKTSMELSGLKVCS